MLIFIRSTYLTLSSCLNFAPLVAYRIRFPFLSIIHIIFFLFSFCLFFGCLSPHCTPEFFFRAFSFAVLHDILSTYLHTYSYHLIVHVHVYVYV